MRFKVLMLALIGLASMSVAASAQDFYYEHRGKHHRIGIGFSIPRYSSARYATPYYGGHRQTYYNYRQSYYGYSQPYYGYGRSNYGYGRGRY